MNSGIDSQVGLNEAQRSLLAELGSTAEHRPTFPDGLAASLRSHLHEELAPIADALAPGTDLFIGKFLLGQVLQCEARHVHEHQRPFAWSIPTARGTVAHRAVELSVHWRTVPLAAELVDEALASLANNGTSLAEYLTHLNEKDRALLRSDAVNAAQGFLDGWPPLRSQPQWRPAVEVRSRYEMFSGAIVLGGKVDLSLGRPDGDRAGRVLIDLKSGRRRHSHVDDLRFYALIEMLRFGTPPRTIASYYLEESRLAVEQITQDVLWAAARRTVDAISRHAELIHDPATAERRPSAGCSWCPLLDGCEPGRAHIAESNEDDIDALG